jgi:hypothetical protein
LTASINDTHQIVSLSPCLQVSRRIYDVALPLIYRDIKLVERCNSEDSYSRLLRSIDLNPSLASLIHTLDLTESPGSGLSALLPRSLALLPRLRSLHLQLGQMKQLNPQNIRDVFFGMPNLETLVIENSCPDTDPNYLFDVLRTLESMNPAISSKLRSLACRTGLRDHLAVADEDIFSNVLKWFPNLQALDLAHTPIDFRSLLAINSNARFQFLRITNCQDSTSYNLAHFLAAHPSVNSSLVVFDGSGVEFTQEETTTLLEGFPSSLRCLNLRRSNMASSQVPQLQKLCRHLEELSVGHGLTMDDVEAMLMRPRFDFDAAVPRLSLDGVRIPKDESEYELVLGPMRDAITLCKLRRRLASVSGIHCHSTAKMSRVRFLDISSLDAEEQGKMTNSVLLGEHSAPLKFIVASNISIEDSHGLQKLCGSCGWRDRWCNGIFWVERE